MDMEGIMRLTPQTKIVIYGAGYCGAMLTELLLANNIYPLCVFDKNMHKQKTRVFDVKIAEPHYLQTDIVIVALLVRGTVYVSIKEYLLKLGYTEDQIVHIYDLDNQRDLFEKQKLVIKPNLPLIQYNKKQWEWLESVLFDDESRSVLIAAQQFLVGDPAAKFHVHPIKEQYFAYEIYKKIEDEEVIECGGFKGEVMRYFIENNNGRFSHYTIIEPDEKYNVFIEANAYGFRSEDIEILNYALSDKKQELYLTNYMNMNSVVSENRTTHSTQKVQARKLDELLPNAKCTFLKVDIEGYELKMLRGAKQTIVSNKPVIAIAAYHHEYDLLEIAKMLLEYNSDYRLFLRSYMNFQEMILYAIPEERLFV